MKILQIHHFYDGYLRDLYSKNPSLSTASFANQISALIEDGFSGSHMFTPYMKDFGWDPMLVIANCAPSQQAWLNENKVGISNPQDWIYEVCRLQIEHFKPEVLYLSHPVGFDDNFINSLKHKPKFVLGWRAASVPPQTRWSKFNLMLSHIAACREKALSLGAKKTRHFFPGFPTHLAPELEKTSKVYDIVFSGQWSPEHAERNNFLSFVAKWAKSAPRNYSVGYFLSVSPGCVLPAEVAAVNLGPRWGKEMYQALRSGRIVINAEIDLAKGDAGNMRLFETTGSGSFLLTEFQPNISQYFEPGLELETFKTAAELAEKIDLYLQSPERRQLIAQAGQRRCLNQYSVQNRAKELSQIIHEEIMQTQKPQDVAQLLLQSLGLINAGKTEESLQLIELAEKLPDCPAGAQFGKAFALAKLGRLAEAQTILGNLLAKQPNHSKARALVEEIGRVPVVQPGGGSEDFVNNAINQALESLKVGNWENALALIINAKAQKVSVRDLDHVRAMCFLERRAENYLGEARQALLEELRHYPDNKAAEHLLAEVVEEQRSLGADKAKSGDEEFDLLLQEIRPYTMLPEIRLFTLFQLAKQVCQADIPGNFAECGVAGGGSSALLAAVIKKYSRRPRTLFAFDSYEGMPAPTEHDQVKGKDAESTGWGTGTCAAPEDSVKQICAKLGVSEIVKPVKGYFENTLPGARPMLGELAFLHADCDWYESAKSILANLYDCVVPGGVLQIDDYGYWDGMKKAIDEYQTARALRFDMRNIDGGSAWFQKPI